MLETRPAHQFDGAESWTRREIEQQPTTLRATQSLLLARKSEIEAFLEPLLARPELRIILTGAGTSAFIGESLAPWLSSIAGRPVEAIATTDIVSAPALFLRDVPTLLVSFGRSGNSPESIAALTVTEAAVGNVHHLILTCNAGGALAQRGGADALVVVLPEATHDRGFAMTSSFTAMMLAALSIFTGIGEMSPRVEAIAQSVASLARSAEERVNSLSARRFTRVVYLGSGVFKGLAREAALKLLELSDGELVSAFDSSMGFRHGPKTIVNSDTLIVVFVSNDPLTRPYDLDLVEELRADGHSGAVVTVAAGELAGDGIAVKYLANAADVDLLFPFIVPAQLFALQVSHGLGLNPDLPSASGAVNRVVKGVTIHTLDR